MKSLIYLGIILIGVQCFACPSQNISKKPEEEKIHEYSKVGKDSPRAPWPRSTVAVQFVKHLSKDEITSCFGSLIHKVEKIDGEKALVWMYIADAWELSRYSMVKEINNPKHLQLFNN